MDVGSLVEIRKNRVTYIVYIALSRQVDFVYAYYFGFCHVLGKLSEFIRAMDI